jgi:hypothetical protein
MADRIVLDSGPLVALARADALDVLAAFPDSFVAPLQVRFELEAGAERGHVVIDTPSVVYLPLADALNPLALAELGAGEAAVIQHALEQRIGVVGIDERKGRRAARAVGLTVTGTLGLLARAKILGVLSALRPIVERMQARGVWFDEDLVERGLVPLGE